MSNCASFDQLVPKSVQFKIDDDTHVNIVPILATDLIEIQKNNETNPLTVAAQLVAKCVVDDNCKPLMTAEQALQLPIGVLNSLAEQTVVVSKLDSKPKN